MKPNRLLPNLVLWLFPVAIVALVVAAFAGIVALTQALWGGVGARQFVQWLVVPLIFAVSIGAREALRYKPQPAEGIEVQPAEHPALWAEVNELARLAETAPPARIVIVPEVNAAVSEAAGQRELVIGLPLLATFTRGQLRSVLAHELGHFAGGDTSAATKVMRRVQFLEQVRARVSIVWRWFFSLYARLYALAAGPVSRMAELRADDLSVRIAGPQTAAESFRALTRADFAWGVALENYVPLFETSGRRAPIGEAVRRIIEANAEDLEPEIDRAIAAGQQSATDTHPPTRERIARFEQAARAGVSVATPPDADLPAVDLLTGGSAWLDAAEAQVLTQDRPLTTWDDVIAHGIRGSIDGSSDRIGASLRSLQLGDGGLDSVLRLIDDPDPVGKVTGGESGEQARSDTIEALATPVLSALLASGAARVVPSWSGPAQIVAADGSELDVEERLASAIDACDSAPVRAWLADQGVDVASAKVEAGGGVPQWLAAISHLTGPWEGRRDVHQWTHGILALPQLDKATVKENKEQVAEKYQHPRLYAARSEGLEAGRALEGSL